MVMPLSATFDYFAVVPRDPEEGRPWPAQSRHPRERGDDTRLVGFAPSLLITEAGPTPNPGWDHGRWLPSVLRSRITLTASGRKGASVRSASFYADRGLLSRLQADDTVHLARTGIGGLAISMLRGDALLAAVGEVTVVPLGNDIVARYPAEFVQAVEALVKKRDPEFELREIPIEFRYGNQCRMIYRTNRDMGPYRILMEHGFLTGMPGAPECVAISRIAELAANASAQILDTREIELVEW